VVCVVVCVRGVATLFSRQQPAAGLFLGTKKRCSDQRFLSHHTQKKRVISKGFSKQPRQQTADHTYVHHA
jgi:hypothetical protein